MMAGAVFSKNTAMASVNGQNSPSSACSPVAPAPWVFAATIAPPLTALTHDSSVKAANRRPAAVVASKPLSSGSLNNSTSCPTATGSTLLLLCPTCSGRSSMTTGRCSMSYSVVPPAPCFTGHKKWALKPAFSAPCCHGFIKLWRWKKEKNRKIPALPC